MKETMKKYRFISIALIGSLALLATACVEEITSNEDQYRLAGTPISFSAETGYDNGVETRAEYSGVYYGGALNSSTPTYERIDWVNKDTIKIVYNQTHVASYSVKGSTIHNNNTQNSYAELNLAQGSSALEWDAGGTHTFYALYPSGGRATTGTLSNTGLVTGSIPSDQPVTSKVISATENGVTFNKYQPDTEHFGYLVACETVTSSSNPYSVDLHFKPAVTTFEFKLKHTSGEPDPRIMSIDLETETVNSSRSPLTGTFEFQILGRDESDQNNLGANWNKSTTTGTNPTRITNPGYKITVDFGTNGFQFANNNGYLDFSILALPIELTGLKLTIHFANGDKVHTFKDNRNTASEAWHTFAPAKKYIISNYAPSGEWVYVLQPIGDFTVYGHEPVSSGLDFNVISYKYPALDPTNLIPVPWKARYSTNSGTSWADVNTSTGQATSDFWLKNGNSSGAQGSGSTSGEARSAQIQNNSSSTTESQTELNKAIAEMQHGGQDLASTAANAFDLSMHPIYGDITQTLPTRTTANCYVVSRSGWYKFPCVYGNAITNGQTNTSAFDPSSASELATPRSYVSTSYPDVNYAFHFKNAMNKAITDPWVVTDITAANNSTAPSSLAAKVVWQDTPNNSVILADNATNLYYSNGYIYFYIANSDIKPGNIVIALTGDFGSYTDTIMWSWHIWVTNKDLSPSVTLGGTTMMNVNLGWMDSDNVSKTTYNNRSILYKIVQTETGGLEEDFSVTQIGDSYFSGRNVGTNPYYQWGRKDPIIPAVDETHDKTVTKGRAGANTTAAVEKMKYHPYDWYTVGDINDAYPRDGFETEANYGKGIREPYHPISNSYTTGWVGGPVIPFWVRESCYHYYYDGPYGNTRNYWSEDSVAGFLASYVNNNPPLDNSRVTLFNWVEFGWVYKKGTASETKTWSTDQVNYFVNVAHSIPSSDFTGPNVVLRSNVNQRKDNAICYNLWNAYAFTDDNYTGSKVYKTIYDPCPVGYVVPSRDTYTGLFANDDRKRVHYPNGDTSATPDGLEFKDANGEYHFFPYTGGRVWYWVQTTGGLPEVQDPYHWTHDLMLHTEYVQNNGFYWTSGHKTISTDHQGNTNRDNHYVNFPFAYIFLFDAGDAPENGAAHYTTGSAGTIRPMVDPHYSAPSPSSSSAAAPNGSINSFNNGGEIPE